MLKNGVTKQVTYPDTPAATLEELKSLLKIEDELQDTYLEGLLLAATFHAQNFLNRSLIYTDWIRQYDAPDKQQGLRIEYSRKQGWASLPYSPLLEITKIVTVDPEGSETAITGYYLDAVSEPERIYFTRDYYGREIAQLLIEYTSGYGGSPADVPPTIRNGIIQHAAYMFEHRGDCGAEMAAKKSGAHDMYGMMRVGLV